MFNKRALQIQMVKAQTEPLAETDEIIEKDWDAIAEVATRFVRDGAIIIGGVYIATRAFKTVCKITEIAADAYFQ